MKLKVRCKLILILKIGKMRQKKMQVTCLRLKAHNLRFKARPVTVPTLKRIILTCAYMYIYVCFHTLFETKIVLDFGGKSVRKQVFSDHFLYIYIIKFI